MPLDHPGKDAARKFGQDAAIEVDHLAQASGFMVANLSAQAEPGVVDEAIDMLALRRDVGEETVGGTRLGQVERDGAGLAEFGGERLDPVLAAGDQHQPGAGKRTAGGRIRRQARRTLR